MTTWALFKVLLHCGVLFFTIARLHSTIHNNARHVSLAAPAHIVIIVIITLCEILAFEMNMH